MHNEAYIRDSLNIDVVCLKVYTSLSKETNHFASSTVYSHAKNSYLIGKQQKHGITLLHLQHWTAVHQLTGVLPLNRRTSCPTPPQNANVHIAYALLSS